jgi:hypothetical protein
MSDLRKPALELNRPQTSSMFGPRYNEGSTDDDSVRVSKNTLWGCCVSIPMAFGMCVLLIIVLGLRGCYAEDAEVKLFNAAGSGDTATVERLVNEGVDVDGRDMEWYPDTPLVNAVRGGHIDIVKFLIDHHAQTTGALDIAIENHLPDIVRLLKAAEAKE